MMRRHHTNHNAGADDGFLKYAGWTHRFWQTTAGKEFLVDALSRDRFGDFFFVSPEAHAMRALTSQDNGERCAPGTCAEDGDLAHVLFAPKRLSVPASKRRMFSWCLAIMSREVALIKPRAIGVLPQECI